MSELFEVPITSHPKLPDGVPLVADFNDMRNRLSYYYPILREIDDVRTPVTKFFSVEGDFDSYPKIEYREITRFMQDIQARKAFVRGDYSSGKFDGETGSKIESQDPYDIETVVIEMLRQLSRSKRHLGGRIAVREWIPHDVEVRYFIRNGKVMYWDSTDEFHGAPPVMQSQIISQKFDTFSWSVDFIRHSETGEWYCTDAGLDGLYYGNGEWVAISEHLDEEYSPEKYADEMPDSDAFLF